MENPQGTCSARIAKLGSPNDDDDFADAQTYKELVTEKGILDPEFGTFSSPRVFFLCVLMMHHRNQTYRRAFEAAVLDFAILKVCKD